MNPTTALPIRRALISVSDKTGIVDFARALIERGVEILSTGGTAKLLAGNGIPAVEVISRILACLTALCQEAAHCR